jgi:hypothetical protein
MGGGFSTRVVSEIGIYLIIKSVLCIKYFNAVTTAGMWNLGHISYSAGAGKTGRSLNLVVEQNNLKAADTRNYGLYTL